MRNVSERCRCAENYTVHLTEIFTVRFGNTLILKEKINMTEKNIVNNPIFFERNRVARIYTGGKLFSGFFGDEPVDGFLPEEWVC